jgi:hypothetical protein
MIKQIPSVLLIVAESWLCNCSSLLNPMESSSNKLADCNRVPRQANGGKSKSNECVIRWYANSTWPLESDREKMSLRGA